MTIIDNTLVIDGDSLTMAHIIAFIENKDIKVRIATRAKERINNTRRQIEEMLQENGKVIYGLHTGLGRLKDYIVLRTDQEQYQRNILYSHASGVGICFDDVIVRLLMLIRANVFCKGNSGVRLAMVQRLVDFINADLYPQLPQIGSLGVGDLQPMAELGLCLTGVPEGKIKYQDYVASAPVILERVGLKPVDFQFAEREALALLSGSTAVLAASLYAWYKANRLLDVSDAALALSVEAFRGEMDAYDDRIHKARNIEGQTKTAERIRLLVSGSALTSENTRNHFENSQAPRVQDPVSFRASPQIHGAVKDALSYVESVMMRELNATTDNPLFFENEQGQLESLSGGNFHGSLLSYSMDLLGIVTTDLGILSERRSTRLLDPTMSYGLPSNLIMDQVGLNTGFALIQASATALVAEAKVLATPASVGSLPAKNNQEDHNSMAMGGVRKALQILDHLEIILAIELLCAAQGIDIILKFVPSANLGFGTSQLHQFIRREIPPMLTDSYGRGFITKMLNLVREKAFTDLLSAILKAEPEPEPQMSILAEI